MHTLQQTSKLFISLKAEIYEIKLNFLWFDNLHIILSKDSVKKAKHVFVLFASAGLQKF